MLLHPRDNCGEEYVRNSLAAHVTKVATGKKPTAWVCVGDGWRDNGTWAYNTRDHTETMWVPPASLSNRKTATHDKTHVLCVHKRRRKIISTPCSRATSSSAPATRTPTYLAREESALCDGNRERKITLQFPHGLRSGILNACSLQWTVAASALLHPVHGGTKPILKECGTSRAVRSVPTVRQPACGLVGRRRARWRVASRHNSNNKQREVGSRQAVVTLCMSAYVRVCV